MNKTTSHRMEILVVAGMFLIISSLSLNTASAAAPLTPEEKALIGTFEKSMNVDPDASAAARLFDANAFADRVIAKARVDAADQPELRRGLGSMSGFLEPMKKNIADKGNLRFLRPEDVNGERHLLFRLQGEAGVNYLAMIVEKKNGAIKIVDFNSMLLGDQVSDVTATEVLRMILSRKADAKADPMQQPFIQMTQAMRAGQLQKVLDIYNGMDPKLKSGRAVLLLRMAAAQSISEAEYAKAIDDLVRLLPGDASAALISIDGLLMAKRYDDTLAAIDRVDAAVHDPFLNSLRGAVRMAQGDAPAAVKLARMALAAEPQSYQTVDLLLSAGVVAKDHAAVTEGLERLEFDLHSPVGDLKNSDTFAEFVASPAYDKWIASRKARAATQPARAG